MVPKGFSTNRSAVNPGRFKYPLAIPYPPIYNSPTTPTGCNIMNLFTIYTWVLAIGIPMFIFSSFVRSFNVDHTVVSVGPYTLIILPLKSSLNIWKRSFGSGSPPNNTDLTAFKQLISPPEININFKRDGVNCKRLILFLIIVLFNRSGSFCWISEATTTFKPTVNGSNVSSKKISKEMVVKANITVFG